MNEYDGTDSFGTQDRSHDDNGNLNADGNFVYKYDFKNRLRKVYLSNGTTLIATYDYDAMDRRIHRKVENSGDLNVELFYYYDGISCIEERKVNAGNEELIFHYVNGIRIDEVINMFHFFGASGTEYYYHYDGKGWVTALTEGNESGQTPGAIHRRYEYTPYGVTSIFTDNYTAVSENDAFDVTDNGIAYNRTLYAGREYDPETNLYYYRARHYSPETGRFIQRDPIGYNDPWGLMNMYTYVGNNPVSRLDPLGCVTITIHGVNTEAEWFANANEGLVEGWKNIKNANPCQQIINFSWGDRNAKGGKGQQGGPLRNATDDVQTIIDSPRHGYMVRSANRLKKVLLDLDKINKANPKKREPINVVAHSQGTIITLLALSLSGVKVNNLIFMGSPLDAEHGFENDVLLRNINYFGKLYNYWSRGDQAAVVAGGMGGPKGSGMPYKDFNWLINRGDFNLIDQFGIGEAKYKAKEPSVHWHGDFMKTEYMKNIQAYDTVVSKNQNAISSQDLTAIKDFASKWR